MSSSHQQTQTVDSNSNTKEQLQLLESQILDLKIIVEHRMAGEAARLETVDGKIRMEVLKLFKLILNNFNGVMF